MKFKFRGEDLMSALDVISQVKPKPLTAKGDGGYLLVVKGDICSVYSRNSTQVARADFPITDVDGEGAFTYPSAHIKSLRYFDTCTLESDQKDDGQHFVRYAVEGGASGERSSYDPKLLLPCDRDVEAAEKSFKVPAGILREALSLGSKFALRSEDKTSKSEYNKVVQMYDKNSPGCANGDGYMFASDSIQTYYFESEVFQGKSLAVHTQHLGALLSFLSKCSGEVTIRQGTHMTFAVNHLGQVFGWAHQTALHPKFSYYKKSVDGFVLAIPRELFLRLLTFTSEESTNVDKAKFTFDHTNQTIGFSIIDATTKIDTFRIPVRVVEPVEGEVRTSLAGERGFAINVCVGHLLDLVNGIKIPEVELRVAIISQPGAKRESAIFRTIDTFRMDTDGKIVPSPKDSYECRITRFVASRD